jgi:hypothetical protein
MAQQVGSRVTKAGVLFIDAHQYRKQEQNHADANAHTILDQRQRGEIKKFRQTKAGG